MQMKMTALRRSFFTQGTAQRTAPEITPPARLKIACMTNLPKDFPTAGAVLSNTHSCPSSKYKRRVLGNQETTLHVVSGHKQLQAHKVSAE
jgi:hypothetical protein